MRSLSILLPTILLVLTQASTPARAQGQRWLQDDDSGLSVPLPKGWSVRKEGPLLGAVSPKDDAVLLFVTTTKHNLAALEEMDLETEDDCEIGDAFSMKSVRTAGRDGLHIKLSLLCESGRGVAHVLLLDAPSERVFVLIVAAESSAIARVRPTFERVLRGVSPAR